MAVPKHLGAYSVECFDPAGGPNQYPNCPVYRSNFNAVVDDVDLHETYFPGWRAAVDPGGARAQGCMCSYQRYQWGSRLLEWVATGDTLVAEWGLDGFVISDAGAVGHASDAPIHPPGQNFTHGLRAAAVGAIQNGTTISIEGTSPTESAFQTQLLEALMLVS